MTVFHCVFSCPGVLSQHWHSVQDHCHAEKIKLLPIRHSMVVPKCSDLHISLTNEKSQLEFGTRHTPLGGSIRKDIWHKNLSNKICLSTCCGNPMSIREQLRVAYH